MGFSASQDLDTDRIQSRQVLRRVLGQWDGLAGLKDEIRRVEGTIRQAEDDQAQETDLSSLKSYLKGLRYNLDCRMDRAA